MDQFKIGNQELGTAILDLLIKMRATQLAQNRIFATKICATKKDAFELMSEVKKSAAIYAQEICEDLFEKYGQIDLSDLLTDK